MRCSCHIYTARWYSCLQVNERLGDASWPDRLLEHFASPFHLAAHTGRLQRGCSSTPVRRRGCSFTPVLGCTPFQQEDRRIGSDKDILEESSRLSVAFMRLVRSTDSTCLSFVRAACRSTSCRSGAFSQSARKSTDYTVNRRVSPGVELLYKNCCPSLRQI